MVRIDFAPLVVAAAMVTSGAAIVKDLLGNKVREAVTFLLVYVVALGVTFALKASDFAASVKLGGVTLEGINNASVLLIAFAVMSLARVYYETKKSLDGQDSAVETKLNIGE